MFLARSLASVAVCATFVSLSANAFAQPVVTAGPLLSSAPPTFALPSAQVQSVVYGAGQYMALFGGASSLFVGRADATGHALAPTFTTIAQTTTGYLENGMLAFDGTAFRAFWTTDYVPGGLGAAVIAPNGVMTRTFWAPTGAAIPESYQGAACTPTGTCAVLWVANGGVYGIRFDADAKPLDVAPIPLVAPAGGGMPITSVQITSIASNYLVLEKGASQTAVQRFDANLTPLSPAVTIALPTDPLLPLPMFAGSSSGAALAWKSSGDAAAQALLFDANGAPREAAPLILGGFKGDLSSMTPVGSDFALLISGVNQTTEAEVFLLSAAGKGAEHVVADPSNIGEVSAGGIASDGTNVFLVSSSEHLPMLSAFVSNVAAPGALVRPASFRTVTASEAVPALAWDGARFLAAWRTSVPTVNGVTVNVASIDLAGNSTPVASLPNGGVGLALASNGSGYAIALSQLNQIDVYAAANGNAPVLAGSHWSNSQNLGDVSMATNGSEYLAVYANWEEGERIRGMASSPADGGAGLAFGAPFEIGAVGSLENPGPQSDVAWNGSAYAVTWRALLSGPSPYDAAAAFVSPDGTLLAGPLSLTDSTGSGIEETVACAPGSCVFVWTTQSGGIATRAYDAKGVPSGPPTTLTVPGEMSLPRIAWDGHEYILAALLDHPGRPNDVVATALDAKGAASAGGFVVVAESASPRAVAGSGSLSGGSMRMASDGAGHTALSFVRFQDQRDATYLLAHPGTELDAGIDASDGGPNADAGGREAGPIGDDAGRNDASIDSRDDGSADASSAPGGDSSSGCGCAIVAARSTLAPFPSVLVLVALPFRVALRRRRRQTR